MKYGIKYRIIYALFIIDLIEIKNLFLSYHVQVIIKYIHVAKNSA